jgi:hypothetical protein
VFGREAFAVAEAGAAVSNPKPTLFDGISHANFSWPQNNAMGERAPRG